MLVCRRYDPHAAAACCCLPAGIDTENLTMLVTPYTQDLVGPATRRRAATAASRWGGLKWLGGVGLGSGGGRGGYAGVHGRRQLADAAGPAGRRHCRQLAPCVTAAAELGCTPALAITGRAAALPLRAGPLNRTLPSCRPPFGVQAWIIAVIVGMVLIVVPVPAYLLVRWRKRQEQGGGGHPGALRVPGWPHARSGL